MEDRIDSSSYKLFKEIWISESNEPSRNSLVLVGYDWDSTHR